MLLTSSVSTQQQPRSVLGNCWLWGSRLCYVSNASLASKLQVYDGRRLVQPRAPFLDRQEVYNHMAVNDKVLAEYVVSLHDQSSSLTEFKNKLNSALPDSAIENIDRLILSLHPWHKNITTGFHVDANGPIETDKQKRLFPGLSLSDQEIDEDVLMQEVDHLMGQFEGAAKKKRDERKEEILPQRRNRSRSRSPPRRRSRSLDRGRSYESRRGSDYMPFDDRPILFKIYSGRVSCMKDFGAFVQLEGVAGRVEGKHMLGLVF